MSNEEKEEQKKKNEDVAESTWDNWIDAMTDQVQPDVCDIDDEDCEACGS